MIQHIWRMLVHVYYCTQARVRFGQAFDENTFYDDFEFQLRHGFLAPVEDQDGLLAPEDYPRSFQHCRVPRK